MEGAAPIVAITGSRDLGPGDEMRIELAMANLLAESAPEVVRFGGARGADTVALRAASSIRMHRKTPELLVIVPGLVAQQPAEASETIRQCADAVIEMELPLQLRTSFHARNRYLVAGEAPPARAHLADLLPAEELLAFWNGSRGGTLFTVDLAESHDIPVQIVPLHGITQNPRTHMPGADVYIVGPYVSARGGRRDPLSEYVRRAKASAASLSQHRRWGERIAGEVVDAFPRRKLERAVVVPVPRRRPGRSSGMARLAEYIAGQLGAQDAVGMLRRVREPEGGTVKARRTRHTPRQHADSMEFDVEHPYFDPRVHVVLLDNVIATGGTMAGAIEAIRRVAPQARITGIALTGALEYEPEKG